jgi:hypothetical protein
MKYILMMHGKKGAWDEFARWSKEDLQRNVEFMQRFNKKLHDSGVFVDTKGLAWPQEAKIVRGGITESQLPTACSRNRRSSLPDTGSST